MPNSTLSDIVVSVHGWVECVHEGMKLLHIREKKARSNVQQLVLNNAFDFPALENSMQSRL